MLKDMYFLVACKAQVAVLSIGTAAHHRCSLFRDVLLVLESSIHSGPEVRSYPVILCLHLAQLYKLVYKTVTSHLSVWVLISW